MFTTDITVVHLFCRPRWSCRGSPKNSVQDMQDASSSESMVLVSSSSGGDNEWMRPFGFFRGTSSSSIRLGGTRPIRSRLFHTSSRDDGSVSLICFTVTCSCQVEARIASHHSGEISTFPMLIAHYVPSHTSKCHMQLISCSSADRRCVHQLM